jgi:hypothetical protein
MRATAGVAVAVTLGALTWLGAAATAEETNLLAARGGAEIIKRTSELGGDWRAARLIDEQTGPTGWASADGSLPQEIIFRLPALSRFNTLVFDPSSSAPAGEWAKDIAVYAADPFPTMGGWKLVAHVQLKREPGDQTFSVPPTDGRFIRLEITSAQAPGAPRVSLNKFKLFLR